MPRKGPHRYGKYEREHKDDTADRMAARRLYIKAHGPIPDGYDVDHTKSIKGGGAPRSLSNLRVRKAGPNRGDKTY